jgi:hypothetical protein
MVLTASALLKLHTNVSDKIKKMMPYIFSFFMVASLQPHFFLCGSESAKNVSAGPPRYGLSCCRLLQPCGFSSDKFNTWRPLSFPK